VLKQNVHISVLYGHMHAQPWNRVVHTRNPRPDGQAIFAAAVESEPPHLLIRWRAPFTAAIDPVDVISITDARPLTRRWRLQSKRNTNSADGRARHIQRTAVHPDDTPQLSCKRFHIHVPATSRRQTEVSSIEASASDREQRHVTDTSFNEKRARPLPSRDNRTFRILSRQQDSIADKSARFTGSLKQPPPPPPHQATIFTPKGRQR